MSSSHSHRCSLMRQFKFRAFKTAASTKHLQGKLVKNNVENQPVPFLMTDWSMCGEATAHLGVCVCVTVTHAGAQAAWQARPPFGWLASRQEHGRGRKWSLAAGSRKDWKSSSPAMNRHRDTKHGSQSSTTHRPPEPKQPHRNSPHHAPTATRQLTLNLSINTEECVLSKKLTGHAAKTHSGDSKHPECHACLSLRCPFFHV